MVIPRFYEELKKVHVNTMPPRSYYIPAEKKTDDLTESRENSGRFFLLSGWWRFKYYSSIYDLEEPFFEEGYFAEKCDNVFVPGMWQNYGYDCHQYTNVKYPFPLDPPYVPHDNLI